MKPFWGILLGLLILSACTDSKRTDVASNQETIERLRESAQSLSMECFLAKIDSLEQTGALSEFDANYWRASYCDGKFCFRLARYYYQKAFDTFEEPISDWKKYADTGLRLAIMHDDMEDTDAAVRLVLHILHQVDSLEAVGSKDLPRTDYAFALEYMSEWQLELGQIEEAQQNQRKAYEVLTSGNQLDTINTMIMCMNFVSTETELQNWDEAEMWIKRGKKLYHKLEQTPEAQGELQDLLLEYRNMFLLSEAYILQAKGKTREARETYDSANDTNLLNHPHNLNASTRYLLAAGYYDEAIACMERWDTIRPMSERPPMSFDIILNRLQPRFEANIQAGHTEAALALASEMCQAIDSALTLKSKTDLAEFSILFETQKKEQALQRKEALERMLIIVILGLVIILLISIVAHWRVYLAKKALHDKNRELFDTVQLLMNKEQSAVEHLQQQPMQELSASQKLYRQLLTLMSEKQVYTDCNLRREKLAQMLGTNYSYLTDAIHECCDMTLKEFLDDFRIRHAAALIANTDDPVGFIIDASGFNSRSHFSVLFRDRYKMTPSEYRRIAQEKKE